MFREGGGSFDYKPKSFDDALLISTYGIFAFLVAGFIREKLMFNYPNKIKIDNNDKIFNSKYRKLIWIIFCLIKVKIYTHYIPLQNLTYIHCQGLYND